MRPLHLKRLGFGSMCELHSELQQAIVPEKNKVLVVHLQ